MTETSRVAAPRTVELDELLLETKLAIPLPRDGFVSRSALVAKGRESGCRVIAISAPSGYGKSTLLSEWAAAEDRPVAWLTVDHFDDDPATLLSSLASAFVRATGADPSLVADMRGHGASSLGRAAPRLAAALRATGVPFVMMLDDLHELSSPECHDVLSVVIGGIPQGSQLIAASRIEQPHIPRLRAFGNVLEIGVDDLALNAAGAQLIFAEADVDLPVDLADLVIERTEGWPVGVYLAAIIAHESEGATIAVSGEDRYVADYLYRESLATLPVDTRRFLRRTAILDRLTAELCDAVVGRFGSQRRLRELESSNVFLLPLDRHRSWFRYHPLFREFLLGELHQAEPELIPVLHNRAADWYEFNGSPAMAVEHLLETHQTSRCVRLVTEIALPTYQAGQIGTIRRWMSTLGDEAVAAYPPLAVLAGWIAVMSGRAEDADRWANLIEGVSFDLPPADGTASFDSGRAMLRAMMCANGPGLAMADATFGLTQEPSWSAWRDQAIYLVGAAHLALGEIERADDLFSEASERAVAVGNHDVHVLSDAERGIIAMDRGRWVEATQLVEQSLESIDEYRLDDYAMSAIAFAGAARLALHRGDLATTGTQLTKAMRARQFCSSASPALAIRVRVCLARTYVALGDHTTARHLMSECEAILARRPALGTARRDVTAITTILGSGVLRNTGAPPLTPAELRLLPYLQTHLTVPEIAARLYVSRNTVSTEVGSIYRKLGVSSRNDAVDRATAIGLIGG